MGEARPLPCGISAAVPYQTSPHGTASVRALQNGGSSQYYICQSYLPYLGQSYLERLPFLGFVQTAAGASAILSQGISRAPPRPAAPPCKGRRRGRRTKIGPRRGRSQSCLVLIAKAAADRKRKMRAAACVYSADRPAPHAAGTAVALPKKSLARPRSLPALQAAQDSLGSRFRRIVRAGGDRQPTRHHFQS